MRRKAVTSLTFLGPLTAIALTIGVAIPVNAAFIPGRTFTVDENAPTEGVLILSSTEFVSGVILPQFVPVLGFVIFCEGAVAGDRGDGIGTGCDPNTSVGQGISDIFEWYRNDSNNIERYFLRVFSDLADSGEPPDKNTVNSSVRSCADLSGQCFAIAEPGHVQVQVNPPLFVERFPEILEYTPATQELANEPHPGFISADRNRSYILVSDVPEPSTFATVLLVVAALSAIGLMRARKAKAQ